MAPSMRSTCGATLHRYKTFVGPSVHKSTRLGWRGACRCQADSVNYAPAAAAVSPAATVRIFQRVAQSSVHRSTRFGWRGASWHSRGGGDSWSLPEEDGARFRVGKLGGASAGGAASKNRCACSLSATAEAASAPATGGSELQGGCVIDPCIGTL